MTTFCNHNKEPVSRSDFTQLARLPVQVQFGTALQNFHQADITKGKLNKFAQARSFNVRSEEGNKYERRAGPCQSKTVKDTTWNVCFSALCGALHKADYVDCLIMWT